MANTNARKIYDAVGARAVLTEQEDLRKYLTGISTSFGYVLSDEERTVFYTDSRYIEAARAALDGTEIEVQLYDKPILDIVKPYGEVAIALERTTYPVYAKLKEAGLQIKDSTPAFCRAMALKQPYELESIAAACKITDDAFRALLPRIREGMSESDVAAELEYLMRRLGASGTSFATIVGFGKNSSVPHHETGADRLKFGDVVLIDFGCKVNGYCSDCTRTFLFGDDKKHGDFKKAYGHVLAAHMLAKEKITNGVTGREADGFARGYLEEHGLGKYFTHSLGHGIGINIHEHPMLSPKSDSVLENTMVFSDEPGVYLEGDFGIRIEDSCTLQDGRTVSLTCSDRNLFIL